MRDGSLFLNFLSDFWTTVWQDKQLLSAALGAQVELLHRMYLQAVRVAAPDFIDALPVFQEDFWNLISFEERAALPRAAGEPYKFRLSSSYASIPFLYNKVFAPTLVLREGVDYFIEQSTSADQGSTAVLVFPANPFADARFPIGDVGQVKTILLFAPKVLIDNDDLHKLFGNLIKIVQPSSEQYRQLVKGAMSLYARGPILYLINAGLNLAAGFPVARDRDRIIGIVRDATHHIIRTERSVEYRVPIVAELLVDVDSVIEPLQTFIRDIQVVDYISEPEWWRGGPSGSDADARVVNYLPADLVPVLADSKRDDHDIIDHLFNTYLKYHVFGVRVNTLALQNFDAIESFFKLVFDVKPAHTSPFVSSFFSAQLTFEEPDDSDVEVHSRVALTRPGVSNVAETLAGENDDYADYFVSSRHVIMNSEIVLNSEPRPIFDSAFDRPGLGADIDLIEHHRIEGGPEVLNSLLVLGAAFLDGTRTMPTLGASLDLEETYDIGTEAYVVTAFDEDTGITTEIVSVGV